MTACLEGLVDAKMKSMRTIEKNHHYDCKSNQTYNSQLVSIEHDHHSWRQIEITVP